MPFGADVVSDAVVSSGMDKEKIIDKMAELKLDMLYCIGGDGTHAAANLLAEEANKRKLKISVVGIPKTIDNDVLIIDRSFGFETAVQEAVKAVKCAKVRFRCWASCDVHERLTRRSCVSWDVVGTVLRMMGLAAWCVPRRCCISALSVIIIVVIIIHIVLILPRPLPHPLFLFLIILTSSSASSSSSSSSSSFFRS
eukprot:1673589-Rhodomonas_salina.2